MMKLKQHNRYGHSLIDSRKTYSWPGEKRLAVYVVNNLEMFSFGEGHGLDLGVVNPPPNQRSYSWRDYGNRVGLVRILDIFDAMGIPAAHNVNSTLYDTQPGVFPRLRLRGDEIIAHGRTNSEKQAGMEESEERALILETTDTIRRHEAEPPQGWIGPWFAETFNTPDLLQEAGYKYLLDWGCDDQPVWLRTRMGRILAVPPAMELNDSTAIMVQNRSAREFADMIVDHFNELVEECERWPLVCGIATHPFIIGQAHRVRPFRLALQACFNHRLRDRVWWTTPGAIARHCFSLPEGTLTA